MIYLYYEYYRFRRQGGVAYINKRYYRYTPTRLMIKTVI